MRGKLVDGIQAVEQCLPFLRSIGALDDVSSCLFTLGEAYRRMGRLDEAIESLGESFAICVKQERMAAAEFNQVLIAATLRDLGRHDEALNRLERPLQLEDRWIKARALLVATDIWCIEGRIDRAWQYLQEGFTLAQWLGSKAYRGVAYRLLGQLRSADTRGQLPPPHAELPDAKASFTLSVQLLQEAHYDDELALTYVAYAQHLLAGARACEAQPLLLQAQVLFQSCGMTTHLDQVRQTLQELMTSAFEPGPGQVKVRLARQGTPRGRPLRSDEFAEVLWTVESAEDQQARIGGGKVAERHTRIRRLCAEASAQGAEPTVNDLAGALGVAARTVDRDIAAMRADGERIVTRGAV